MTINHSQKVVLIIVLCLFTLTLLFIPNTVIFPDGSGGTVMYSFILDQDAVLNTTIGSFHNIILYPVLALEWFGLLLVGGCSFLLASRSKITE